MKWRPRPGTRILDNLIQQQTSYTTASYRFITISSSWQLLMWHLSQHPPSILPDIQCLPIGINLTPSPSTSVGARAVGSGREGLYGRPRPVHRAHILREHDRTPPRGRP